MTVPPLELSTDRSKSVRRPKVLLVDDEPLIRDVLSLTLVEAGFAVIEASSGREALALAGAQAPFDAVITDVRLGHGIDGWTVARAMRGLYPACAVIYMCGYVPGPMEKVATSVLMKKPLRPTDLCKELDRLIRAGALDRVDGKSSAVSENVEPQRNMPNGSGE